MEGEITTRYIYCYKSLTGIIKYIGSTKNYKQRFNKHKQRCLDEKENGYNSNFYKWAREEEKGIDTNRFEILRTLTECDKRTCLQYEKDEFIKHKETILNMSSPLLTKEEINKKQLERQKRPEERIKIRAREKKRRAKPEVKAVINERNRKKYHENMKNPEWVEKERERGKLKQRKKRASETPEQREARLQKARDKRASETPEQREARLQKRRVNRRKKRLLTQKQA